MRLWVEESADNGFRARITQTFDSSVSENQASDSASNPEDIYSVVRTWVEAFIGRSKDGIG